MDDTCLRLREVCLAEAASNISRKMMIPCPELRHLKQTAQDNTTSERSHPEHLSYQEGSIKPLGYPDWGHDSQETLQTCWKHGDTAESEDYRDPALSDPQESVPKSVNKLSELPALKDRDMKRQTEKYLLLLAVFETLITYQAALSPPDSLWQESKADHVFGNLVLSDNHQNRYIVFSYCNATAFFSSLAIILLLVIRKPYASGIHFNMLSVSVILDMIGLTGAFAAGSSMWASTSKYVFMLVFAVLVYIALHVLVRLGSRSHEEHSVLRRIQVGRSKYSHNFAALDLLLEVIGVNAAGNCRTSESADPTADDEHDANRPMNPSPREATWHISSAAPHHMTGNHSLLFTSGYKPVHNGNESVFINLGNREAVPLQVRGIGSVRTESITLDDVWYVPGLDSNLVSTGQLARQGCAISLGRSGGRITRGGALVGTARFTEACQFELDFLKVVDAAPSM